MPGRYDRNYGSNDSDNNSDSDSESEYDDRMNLTLDRQTAIQGEVMGIKKYTHDQYGTSLITNIDDVVALDGVLMEKEENDEKVKLFSWEALGFSRDENGVPEVTEDEVPSRHTLNVAGTQHVYKYVGHATEGDDEHPDTVDVGDSTLFFEADSKGRTITPILSEAGEFATASGDNWGDEFEWLLDDVDTLQDGLKGRTVEIFFKVISYMAEDEEGNEVERSYDQAVVIDQKTDEVIEPPATDGKEQEENNTEDETEEAPETPNAGEIEVPDELQPVLDVYLDRENGIDDKETVTRMAKSQLGEEPNEEDVDAIIQTVEAKAA